MSCPGDNYVVPGANPCAGGGGGVAGVTSLNTQTGAVNIVPSNGTIIVTQGAGQVGLEAVLGGNIVTTLNACIDDVDITSVDSSVTITTNTVAKTIDLSVPAVAGTSVNGAVGAVSILGDGSTSVQTAGQIITISTPASVESLNGQFGNLTIEGDVTGSATVQTFGSVMSIVVPNATVTNILGSGTVTVTEPFPTVFNISGASPPVTNITGSGSVIVTEPTPTVFDINVPAPVYPVTSIIGAGIANVTSVGTDFTVDVPDGVTSIKTLLGVVDLSSSDGSITIVENGLTNTIDFTNSKSPDVTELNGLSGSLNIISSDLSLLITPAGTDIDITVVGIPPVAGVTSVNLLTGILNITGSGGISVASSGQDIDLTVPEVPAYNLYKTVLITAPFPLTNNTYIEIAELTGIVNNYSFATLFLSGNVKIRYDATFTSLPVPPNVNTVYGDFSIRVKNPVTGDIYVPEIRKNCLFLPTAVTPPILVYDYISFSAYVQNFPTTLGATFDLELFITNMDGTTTQIVDLDLSVLVIKATT